jgi:hypothetical protein
MLVSGLTFASALVVGAINERIGRRNAAGIAYVVGMTAALIAVGDIVVYIIASLLK